MDSYLKNNQQLWDQWTRLHVSSGFYDIQGFKDGKCLLSEIEIQELGDVRGKKLLHLQCHFGLDTLSWARRGAIVTGVDFSKQSIETAQNIASEVDIDARFICCDVYQLNEVLFDKFDIVFTSGGVLCWLPDLSEWARVICHFLTEKGIFFIREFHPVADIFDDEASGDELRIRYPYFNIGQPLHFRDQGSYAAPDSKEQFESYEWPHSISEIVNSLLRAGLELESINEYNYCNYQHRPFLSQNDKGQWVYEKLPEGMPLQFTIKAKRKPAR